ncbi:Hypothetical_protein [Hexamita inflata]|uniref:Hypothetical_protein n=1 Tax=Hexamita inflata TaxID=28002 RepID=A0AA86RHS1_9EUKA|nr:Hypothetical protein HINF_LOCUS64422 [Hexamita inflata]
MYRKKVVQRGEKHSEIDVEKPSANRFASLADSDVQFKRTDDYGKIFDYLHERGMMKVATQSPIKEVPAKPRQKNFEKAHKNMLMVVLLEELEVKKIIYLVLTQQ